MRIQLQGEFWFGDPPVEFARFDYSLNAVGNRTSKTDSEVGTTGSVVRAESYGYDAVDQIIGVNYSTNSIVTRSVAYQYDPVGNRTNVTDVTGLGSITTAYLANPLNQYTLVGADAPTYDANGNLTGQAGWTYSYDAQNRLLSATSATLAVQFQYDARNRCVNRKLYDWVFWLLASDF